MASPEQTNAVRRAVATAVLVACVVGFLLVGLLVRWPSGAPAKGSWEGIGIFVAAGLTLVMYSFLYRDNPLFKAAENLYVGVALGYEVIIDWYESLKKEVYDPFFGAPDTAAFLDALAHRIVPIVLGILLLTRLSRKRSWLSRYPYALIIGWGAGIGIPITVTTYVLKQLEPAVAPLTTGVVWTTPPAFTVVPLEWLAWLGGIVLPVLGNVAILVGTVTVLFYFFYSVEHKGVGGGVSRVGIWFLMVSFGASFGYTVMGRVSLFIDRAYFLLTKWLGLGL